jgi:hypothetical protein
MADNRTGLIFQFGSNRRRVFYPMPTLALVWKLAELITKAPAYRSIGISRAAWYKWQKGSTPRSGTLARLAELAGIPLEWLNRKGG